MAGVAVLIDIPCDLLYSVARAVERQATLYRGDKGHDPEDVATLEADADRLDELATAIDFASRSAVAEAWRSAKCPKCNSPSPQLHPAVQLGGECHVCDHDFHRTITPMNNPERIRSIGLEPTRAD